MKSIFVIEDDCAENLALLKILSRLDVHVLTAGSAESAEQMLAEIAPPDLVLLDLRLPGRSGYDFLEMLRAGLIIPKFGRMLISFDTMQDFEVKRKSHDREMAKKMQKIPVIVISGSNSLADITRGKIFAVADYILKPVDPERLLKKIVDCFLGQSQLPTGLADCG